MAGSLESGDRFQAPLRDGCLGLLFAVLMLGMVSCQPTAAPPARETTVEPAPAVQLPLVGKIASRNPIGHRPQVAYVPIESVRLDGSDVEKDAPIVRFRTDVVDIWAVEQENRRAAEGATLALEQLRTQSRLDTYLRDRERLSMQRALLLKQIAATNVKDQVVREELQLRLEQAQRKLQAATERLQRAQAAAEREALRKAELEAAQRQHRLAEDAVQVPKLALEIFDESTGYVSRENLKYELATLDLELGNELSADGLFGRIKALTRQQELRQRVHNIDYRESARRLRQFEEMKANAEVRAKAAGTFIHNPASLHSLEVGSKHPLIPLGFVQTAPELIIELSIPERYRFLVGSEQNAKLTLSIPAFRQLDLAARLFSVGSATLADPLDGQPRFVASAQIADGFDEHQPVINRLGQARVQAGLTLNLAPHLSVPIWYVSSLEQPAVLTVDGEKKPVKGYPLGERFVIVEGVESGSRLQMPPVERGSARRLTGVIQPASYTPLRFDLDRISRWRPNWMFVELVPDGAYVEKGDVVAKVVPGRESADERTYQLRYQEVEKAAQLEIDKIDAQNRMIEAYVAWRQARVTAEKTRLNFLASRFGRFSLSVARAQVAMEQASEAYDDARSQAQRVIADDTGFVSGHRKSEAQMKFELAAIARERATLQQVGSVRQRDWLEVWSRMTDVKDKWTVAAQKRNAYSVARLAYVADVEQAKNNYRQFHRNNEHRTKRLYNSTLYAPRGGRVFYFKQGDEMPAVSKPLAQPELGQMPLPGPWHAEFRVPARYYGKFVKDQDVAVVIPAISILPRTGRIQLVSSQFEADLSEEDDKGDVALLLPEPKFRMIVTIDLSADELRDVAPGLSVYLDDSM